MRRLAGAVVLMAVFVGVSGWATDELSRAEPIRDLFPIIPWEIQPEKQVFLEESGHGILSIRECAFDTVAFVRPDQLELVERAGMRALVGRLGDLSVNWRELSDKAIVDHVKELVAEAGESDALIGYLIADEPSAADFPALGKAVAAVKELAPGKLAYINLFPNYSTRSQLGTATYTEYLERYVAYVKPQFLSYDNYSVLYSLDLTNRARAASYYTNLLEVRRIAAKYGLPFWNAVSSNQIRPYTTVPSPANLRVQAYTTLAAGGRGLTWFTYYAGRYAYAPIDSAGNRTATWSYLKRVNSQVRTLRPILTGLRSTAVYFTAPPPAAGLRLLPGALVDVESPTSLMVGEFSGPGGGRFAIVVNLNLRRGATVFVKSKLTVRRVSVVDRSLTPLPRDGSLWLWAGQGMLLSLWPGISPEEWVWREWWLGEGRFKEYGPRNPEVRVQTGTPVEIPSEWWQRLEAFLAGRNRAPSPVTPPGSPGDGVAATRVGTRYGV
jgi:hypothetical protein